MGLVVGNSGEGALCDSHENCGFTSLMGTLAAVLSLSGTSTFLPVQRKGR